MNPTAAIPISHEPHLRSRSIVADCAPSAVMVAMTDHLLHWAKTPAPPRPLPVRGDAMISALLSSIPWKATHVGRPTRDASSGDGSDRHPGPDAGGIPGGRPPSSPGALLPGAPAGA